MRSHHHHNYAGGVINYDGAICTDIDHFDLYGPACYDTHSERGRYWPGRTTGRWRSGRGWLNR